MTHLVNNQEKLASNPPNTASDQIDAATSAGTFQPVERATVNSDGRFVAGPAMRTATAAPTGIPAAQAHAAFVHVPDGRPCQTVRYLAGSSSSSPSASVSIDSESSSHSRLRSSSLMLS